LSIEATEQGQAQDGCPTVMFAFGKVDGAAISTAEASVVQCRPRIEAVNLNITLLVPSLQIDPTSIPSPINSTRRTLYDGTFGNLTDSADGVVPLGLGMTEYTSLSASLQGPNVNFDDLSKGVFVSMIQGLNGTAPEELATNAKALIKGIQRVYGLVVAQLINSCAREAYTTNSTADFGGRPTLTANLLNTRQVCLKQSAVSTRDHSGSSCGHDPLPHRHNGLHARNHPGCS
jgi:hypothetical protein